MRSRAAVAACKPGADLLMDLGGARIHEPELLPDRGQPAAGRRPFAARRPAQGHVRQQQADQKPSSSKEDRHVEDRLQRQHERVHVRVMNGRGQLRELRRTPPQLRRADPAALRQLCRQVTRERRS